MCIAFIHFEPGTAWPLIIAANRDEFHQRPTHIARPWPEDPQLLGGQDLEAHGTWLALNLSRRRLALLTNYRQINEPTPATPISRGLLVRDFLQTSETASEYLSRIAAQGMRYDGFNLLLAEQIGRPQASLWYYSNRAQSAPRALRPGHYVLSNHLLNTPWPKAKRLQAQMSARIAQQQQFDPRPYLEILGDRQTAADHVLPDTGLDYEREKLLSSIFIQSPEYGTRCSTIILLTDSGQGLFTEQSYDAAGQWTERIDWPLSF